MVEKRAPGDHGTANQAIEFVMNGLDDTLAACEFIRAWSHGDLDEWPEFYEWLDKQATRPHAAPLDLDARARLAREFHLVDEPVGETMSLSWDDLLEGTQERYLAYVDCAIAAALAERPVVDREELVELEAYADDRTAQAFSKMHAMRKCNDTDLADAFERERDAYSDMTMRLRAILALLQPSVVSVERGEAQQLVERASYMIERYRSGQHVVPGATVALLKQMANYIGDHAAHPALNRDLEG